MSKRKTQLDKAIEALDAQIAWHQNKIDSLMSAKSVVTDQQRKPVVRRPRALAVKDVEHVG